MMRVLCLNKETKGYIYGIFSGLFWGIDTLLMEEIISMKPFISLMTLTASGTLVCCLFHDGYATVWLGSYMTVRKKLHCIFDALKTKAGLFCIAGALLGGPAGMSFYMLSINFLGSSYTSLVTSCYPALAVLLAKFFLNEKLSIWSWVGLAVCFSGIAIYNTPCF